MTELVTTTVTDGIAQVRLDRPDKLNGLTLEILHGLVETARALRRDRSIRAVVLAGEGRSFCSGMDFQTVSQADLVKGFPPHPLRGTNVYQEACWVWRRLPVPVIAAVHGHCFGGGLQLATGCDYRFTTPDAQWSVMETKWGLVPDMSGVQALKQLVGIDMAKRLTWTGEVVSGVRAVELGLASEVSDEPVAAATAMALQIAQRSPDAVAGGKRLFDSQWSTGARRTFNRERLEQALLLAAPNTAIARKASQAAAAAARAAKTAGTTLTADAAPRPSYRPRLFR